MGKHGWNPFTAPPEQSSEPEPIPTINGGYIVPLEEKSTGVNFPYRGSEQHGVPVDWSPDKSPEEWEGGIVRFREPEPETEPVAVRIVETSSQELRKFRVAQHIVGASPTLVAGRFNKRTRCTIRNMDADTVAYISSASAVSTWTGYPINFGADLDISADDEVWAISADGSNVSLAVLIEYIVSV